MTKETIPQEYTFMLNMYEVNNWLWKYIKQN
jgi:hypothetical protein